MAIKVPWKRLIRFIGSEDGQTYFGDAVVPSAEFDIGDPANASSLQARIITGDPLSSKCIVGDEVVKVKKLLGPLVPAQVPAIRCIGGNYKSHLAELNMKHPNYPLMFGKFSNTIAGYGDDIPITKLIQDDQVDYEAELAVVIGRDCKDVSVEEAWKYILGYTCSNDLSARKWQMDPNLVGTNPPPQMTFAKGFDGFCPLGPCIVSTEVIRDPHSLPLKTWINGELRQDGNTDDFVFNIPEIIAFCSQGNTLPRGSVILTGTCSGVGFTMSPPQYLKTGDEVRISFGSVGTLIHGIRCE